MYLDGFLVLRIKNKVHVLDATVGVSSGILPHFTVHVFGDHRSRIFHSSSSHGSKGYRLVS